MASDDPAIAVPVSSSNLQVRLQRDGDFVWLHLPQPPSGSASDWSEVWQQLKTRLSGGERFWQAGTVARINAYDRLLDNRQLDALAEALAEVELQLQTVATSRRQTAIAAVTAGYSVEQEQLPRPGWAVEAAAEKATAPPRLEPLYLQSTVRSGGEVRHPGTIVIAGDVNPGGMVIANGDIIIWGRLRGVAHAGSGGDRQCTIAALRMEPTQLRIADVVARAPQSPPQETDAEVAYITPGGLRISRGVDFWKTHTYDRDSGSWSDARSTGTFDLT